MSSASPTKMVAADFEYERPLGTGAFSKVVIGLYKPTGQRYAVKLISKSSILNAPTEEERTRMAEVARRESRMLLLCEHPNIVQFYQSMQTPEDLLYVTELCDGGELLDHIRDLGVIPLEAARYAIAELFSAVFYLHSGKKRAVGNSNKSSTIIHRDIKPENIMLKKNFHLKLIDFGTAVVTDSVHDKPVEENNAQGRAQTFCGTTYYMSPELFQDNYTCCASDYWGCGCVLYHMLVGKRPFEGSTQYILIKAILEKDPDYPPHLDKHAVDLIQKLLVKSPDKRISMDEIKKHPFFSVINFDTLAQTDVSSFWVRDTPWVDEDAVTSCHDCRSPLKKQNDKHFCAKCGCILCRKCLTNNVVVPNNRVSSPQNICYSCYDTLTN